MLCRHGRWRRGRQGGPGNRSGVVTTHLHVSRHRRQILFCRCGLVFLCWHVPCARTVASDVWLPYLVNVGEMAACARHAGKVSWRHKWLRVDNFTTRLRASVIGATCGIVGGVVAGIPQAVLLNVSGIGALTTLLCLVAPVVAAVLLRWLLGPREMLFRYGNAACCALLARLTRLPSGWSV